MDLTSENWTQYLAKKIDESQDERELLLVCSELYFWRYYSGAIEYAAPRIRSRMDAMCSGYTDRCVAVVDLSAITHASWHVAENDADNAIRMLRNLHKQLEPDVFMLAADCGSKRTISDQWKSSREPMPPEFKEMERRVIDYMRSKNVQVVECDGREADDVMASVAFTCQVAACQCVIATEDRDLYQALGKHTAVYSRRDGSYRNAAWVESKYDVTVSQWVDWLCLVGGKNDLPGCYGVAAKKASSLLKAYGDVPNIVHHIDSLTPAMRKHMLYFWENVYHDVKKLHTIERGIPVGWKW